MSLKSFLSASLAAMTLLSSVSAYAFTGDEAENVLFNDKDKVSDQDLNKMRGGFFTAGGLHLTFGITSRTIVDGEVAQSFTIQDFSSHANPSVQELGKLIQIGPNNDGAAAQQVLNSMPALLTVIQNSLDDQVIQHLNVLDVNVANLDSFRQQVQNSQNFGYVAAMNP